MWGDIVLKAWPFHSSDGQAKPFRALAASSWCGWVSVALLLVFLLPQQRMPGQTPRRFDVIVYGATASGVMAATAAAQQHLHVALLEPGQHVGGMVAGGLSYTDVNHQEHLIGGATLTFFKQLGRHYGQPIGWTFEPHVAEETFRAMLNDAGVEVFRGEQVTSAVKQNGLIQSLQCESHHRYAARVFIDSSYEGDLMKAAGVRYVVGREGKEKYGESLAGREDLLPGVHQFSTDVPAAGLLTNLPDGRVAPHITPQDRIAPTGSGDGLFQSYCYRITVTDDPANRLPIPAPPGYNPAQYELLKRYLASNPEIGIKGVLGINRIPNGKGDTNSNGPVSLDYLGGNLAYPDASPAQRREIAKAHLYWAQGLFYFLQNDPGVPPALHQAVHAISGKEHRQDNTKR